MVSDQRGQGKLGTVIWLAVLGAAIFAAIRIVPAKVGVMDFHDYVDSQVQALGTAGRIDEAKFYERILDKAQELQIPLDKKQMKLTVHPQEVELRLRHRVTVDLEVYEIVWDYDKNFSHLRM